VSEKNRIITENERMIRTLQERPTRSDSSEELMILRHEHQKLNVAYQELLQSLNSKEIELTNMKTMVDQSEEMLHHTTA